MADSGRMMRQTRSTDMEPDLRQSSTKQRQTKPRRMAGENTTTYMKRFVGMAFVLVIDVSRLLSKLHQVANKMAA